MKPTQLGMLAFLILAPIVALGLWSTRSGPAPASAQAGNPLANLRTDRAGEPLAGRVEERVAAGPYTYLDVRGAERRVWVVTLGRGAPRGASVRVRSLGQQQNFYSRRLQRTFPELVFGLVSRLDEP
jgi:hypothetical protein